MRGGWPVTITIPGQMNVDVCRAGRWLFRANMPEHGKMIKQALLLQRLTLTNKLCMTMLVPPHVESMRSNLNAYLAPACPLFFCLSPTSRSMSLVQLFAYAIRMKRRFVPQHC